MPLSACPASPAPATRVALITGGSRGLGAALCTQLLAQGWHVIELSRSAPQGYSVRADLCDPPAAAETMDRCLDALDTTSVRTLYFINNAGLLAPMGPTAQHPAATLSLNLQANVVSPVLLLARWVARFQSHPARKCIVNISSGAASTPYAGWSLYGLAKAGMEQHMRCLAAEQAAQPHPFIPVNVYPGVIDTAMQQEIRASSQADFPARPRFVQRHTAGELRPPERVAAALLRLLARNDLQGGERYDVADHGA